METVLSLVNCTVKTVKVISYLSILSGLSFTLSTESILFEWWVMGGRGCQDDYSLCLLCKQMNLSLSLHCYLGAYSSRPITSRNLQEKKIFHIVSSPAPCAISRLPEDQAVKVK
jgi:hypothetical protein